MKEKILVLLGTIIFDHFTEEEKKKIESHPPFVRDKNVAIVKDLSAIMVVESKDEAEDVAEVISSKSTFCDSYIIPSIFCGDNGGLMLFENQSQEDLVYTAFKELSNQS